jgi:hypothetical protein
MMLYMPSLPPTDGKSDVNELPRLRATARKAEEALEAALIAHYGREASGYARFFAPADMPTRVARLVAAERAASDRLMQALRDSIERAS